MQTRQLMFNCIVSASLIRFRDRKRGGIFFVKEYPSRGHQTSPDALQFIADGTWREGSVCSTGYLLH